MTAPRLTLVTNRAEAKMPIQALARHAINGGVDLVQVREPDLLPSELESLVTDVIEAIGAERVAVNGPPDIAARLGVHLHLPERSAVGFQSPDGFLTFSASVHSVESLSRTPPDATFVVAGHLFPTPSHAGKPPLGVQGLEAITRASKWPVVAIGGITPANVGAALQGGAAGVSVMSYVNSSGEPHLAAREIRDSMERLMTHQATGISIQVNGKRISVDAGSSLTSFLERRNLHPRLVVVERNREIVAKSAYDSTFLEEGDLLEIAHFVGGG